MKSLSWLTFYAFHYLMITSQLIFIVFVYFMAARMV